MSRHVMSYLYVCNCLTQSCFALNSNKTMVGVYQRSTRGLLQLSAPTPDNHWFLGFPPHVTKEDTGFNTSNMLDDGRTVFPDYTGEQDAKLLLNLANQNDGEFNHQHPICIHHPPLTDSFARVCMNAGEGPTENEVHLFQNFLNSLTITPEQTANSSTTTNVVVPPARHTRSGRIYGLDPIRSQQLYVTFAIYVPHRVVRVVLIDSEDATTFRGKMTHVVHVLDGKINPATNAVDIDSDFVFDPSNDHIFLNRQRWVYSDRVWVPEWRFIDGEYTIRLPIDMKIWFQHYGSEYKVVPNDDDWTLYAFAGLPITPIDMFDVMDCYNGGRGLMA